MDDLLKVYSDKNALPFFNSDNCDGDKSIHISNHTDRLFAKHDLIQL